jgi:hypothetical protein
MCTELLPPGVNPTSVNKCIISYIIYTEYPSLRLTFQIYGKEIFLFILYYITLHYIILYYITMIMCCKDGLYHCYVLHIHKGEDTH